MFRPISFLLVLALLISSLEASQRISLGEALQRNLVTADVYGLVGGSHEGKSVHLRLENISKSPLEIYLEAGQVFTPRVENVQPLLLVRDEVITLGAGKKENTMLYAYCIKMRAHGPGIMDTFSLGGMATGGLLEIARFFNEKKYYDHGVQDAVWSISDGVGLEDIYGSNLDITNAMRKKVAELTAKPFAALTPQMFSLQEPSVIRTIRTTIEPYKLFAGMVEAYAPPSTELKVVLLDAEGKELRELYKGNTGTTARQLKFPFELDGRTLEKKMYYVRYYIAGQKVRDIPVNNS